MHIIGIFKLILILLFIETFLSCGKNDEMKVLQDIPILTSPSNNQKLLVTDDVILEWNSIESAICYELFINDEYISSTEDAFYQLPQEYIYQGNTFSWKVRAVNIFRYSHFSTTFTNYFGYQTTIIINNDDEYCNQRDVNLVISTSLDNISEMWISNNSEFSSGSWEAFNTTKAWTLAEENGNQTVYIKLRNTEGVESYSDGSISDSIFLDDIPPVIDDFTIASISPGSSPTIDITLSASDINGSGILYWLVNEDSNQPILSAFTEETAPNQFILSHSGESILYAWVVDRAENISEPYPAQSYILQADELTINIDSPSSLAIHPSLTTLYYSTFDEGNIYKIDIPDGTNTTLVYTAYYDIGSIDIMADRLYFNQVSGSFCSGNGAIPLNITGEVMPNLLEDSWFTSESSGSCFSSEQALDWSMFMRVEQHQGARYVYWSQTGSCQRGLFIRELNTTPFSYTYSMDGNRPDGQSGCQDLGTAITKFSYDNQFFYASTYTTQIGGYYTVYRMDRDDLANREILLRTLDRPIFSLVSDNEYVYFCEQGTSGTTSGRITRINRNETLAEDNDVTVLHDLGTTNVKPTEIFLDNDILYFISGDVYKMNKVGTDLQKLTNTLNQTMATDRGGPLFVADNDYIYIAITKSPSNTSQILSVLR